MNVHFKSAMVAACTIAACTISTAYAHTQVTTQAIPDHSGNAQAIELSKPVTAEWKLLPASGAFTVSNHSNVRTGPGLDHDILGRLEPHTNVEVIGGVEGRNWMLLKRGSLPSGYIHSSLLKQFPAAEDTVAPHSEGMGIEYSHAVDRQRQQREFQTREIANHDNDHSQIQLSYLAPGMDSVLAINNLQENFDSVWETPGSLFPVVAGMDYCIVNADAVVNRRQHENALINQLIDDQNNDSHNYDSQGRTTNTIRSNVKECVAVEFGGPSNRTVSAINHISVLTGVTINHTVEMLEYRFGTPDYQESSADRTSMTLGWVRGGNEYANTRLGTLSAVVSTRSLPGSQRYSDGQQAPAVVTKLILE